MSKKTLTFDNFLKLECAKQMGAYNQNMAYHDVRELVESGEVIFTYETPLYDNVIAVIKELGLQAYEQIRPWRWTSYGKDVLICLHGTYWQSHTANFNKLFHSIK